jgi:four helix bundle protein
MNQGRLPVEFGERTQIFSAGVIRLYVKMSKVREEARVLGRNLLRSGTSVTAHVRKASRARSDEEFVSKLNGALQDADENQMWLELLREECGTAPADTLPLEKEADELMTIMTSMINRTKEKQKMERKKQK